MTTGASGKYENDLTQLKKSYWIITVIVVGLVTVIAWQARTAKALMKTRNELQKASAGLGKVAEAIANRKQVLASTREQLHSPDTAGSPEKAIYRRIDEIKDQFRPDETTITAVEKKSGNATLGYTLKFVNARYDHFLRTLQYLRNTPLPHASVDAVSIARSQDGGKPGLTYVVTGSIQMPLEAAK